MNPYTYRKRTGSAGSQTAFLAKNSWLKAIMHAKINSLVAIAFVLFAAGAVAGTSAVAGSEIEIASSEAPVVRVSTFHAQSRVLGDTTVEVQSIVEDSALEAVDPVGKLTVKAVNYDTTLGRWNYSISYVVTNASDKVYLKIGSYVVKAGVTGTGSVETGAILKPNKKYHASLWMEDSTGYKINIGGVDIKTGKAATSQKDKNESKIKCVAPNPTPNATSTNSSASLCIKKTDGTTVCGPSRPICKPVESDLSGNKKGLNPTDDVIKTQTSG